MTFWLFIFSGLFIASLTIAKRIEEKKKNKVLLLRAVSMGDERMRKFSHHSLHLYSEGKEKFAFWLKKQLPLKLKSFWNKFLAYLGEKGVEYFGDVRNTRLLKRSDGISEFFKNVSEFEKGNGEINEELAVEIAPDFYEIKEKPVELAVTESKTEARGPISIPIEIVESNLEAHNNRRKADRRKSSHPKKRKAKALETSEIL